MTGLKNFAEAIGNAILSGYTIDETEYSNDGSRIIRLSLSKFVDDTVEYSKVFDIEEMTEETSLYDKINRFMRFDEILHYNTDSSRPILEATR